MLREAAKPRPPAAPEHGHWILDKALGYYYNEHVSCKDDAGSCDREL